MEKHYKADWRPTRSSGQKEAELVDYVNGPGTGGYHGSLLYPEWDCSSPPEAERIAKLCNKAYEQGWKARGRAIRDVLQD